MSALSERLRAAVSVQGVLAVALDDAVARGQQQFSLPPTDHELQAWAQSLRTSCPHYFPPQHPPVAPDAEGTPPGMPPSVWKSMSPSAKLTWARQAQPPPVVQRRPKPVTLSSEQAAAFAAMPPAQRLAAYRALQEQGKG